MRAIWSGSISFGLVNVPVKAYTAVREHDLHLHQVHDADHGRIRYQRRCEVCGKVIEFANIQRAYDDGEHTVVLTDEDLGSLPAAARGEIEVLQFVPNNQLDPITLDGSYYLKPEAKAAKAYALLLQTLQDTELTAVVRFALRQKTRLGVLRIREDELVVQSMVWPDEVREHEAPDLGSVSLTKREKDLAAALVEQMSGDFDPDAYEDDYQAELKTLIEAKIESGDTVDTAATFGQEAPAPAEGNVIDLMDALKRSIDRRGSGGKEQEQSGAKAKKAPAKKTSTKAAPAKNAPARKAPAKTSTNKSATKKTPAKGPGAKAPNADEQSTPAAAGGKSAQKKA